MFAPIANRSRLLLLSSLLVLLAVAAVACSPRLEVADDANNGGSVNAPTQQRNPTVSAARPDRDEDGVADDDDLCPNLKETGQWTTVADGCPDTIDDLVAFASSEIDAFWAREFDAIGERYDSPSTLQAYDGPRNTGCGETVPANAFYCPNDQGIYYDQSLFDASLADIGDFAPVFILAHEWGHYIQDQLGFLTMRNRVGMRNELQADCFAGLFTQDAEERGLLEPGDTEEALALAFEAGDPSGSRQSEVSHGTPKQRQQAFALGYTKSITECLAV